MTEYKKLPGDPYPDWKKDTNGFLDKFGDIIISKKEHTKIKMYELLKYAVIGLIVFVLIIGWAVYNDKFKTECPTFSCPEIPETPACPNCPECVNTCSPVTNCDFPDSLEVNLNGEE